MGKSKNYIFVVSLIEKDGRKVYYVCQQCHFIHEEGRELVLNQPIGLFTHDLIDAKKFLDRSQAEWCASYFEGACVECIKEGERLK